MYAQACNHNKLNVASEILEGIGQRAHPRLSPVSLTEKRIANQRRVAKNQNLQEGQIHLGHRPIQITPKD